MPIEIRELNAVITSTQIFRDNSGLKMEIVFDYGHSNQKAGPIPLDPNLMNNLMRIANASKWSELPGKPLRVRASINEIYAIAPFLVGNWFEI